MKHYVMIQRPELPADMHAAMSRLNERTGEQLIAAYNAQCELGFTGVYAQAIQVLALHQQLKAKFGKGPLLIEDNALLTMVGPRALGREVMGIGQPGATGNRFRGFVCLQTESKTRMLISVRFCLVTVGIE